MIDILRIVIDVYYIERFVDLTKLEVVENNVVITPTAVKKLTENHANL